jgi:hypothetical protein
MTQFPLRFKRRLLISLVIALFLPVLACVTSVAVPDTGNIPTFSPSAALPVQVTPIRL